MVRGDDGVPGDAEPAHLRRRGHRGGKVATIRHLLEQLSAAGVPWLVVEPAKAEYAGMAGRSAAWQSRGLDLPGGVTQQLAALSTDPTLELPLDRLILGDALTSTIVRALHELDCDVSDPGQVKRALGEIGIDDRGMLPAVLDRL